MPGPSTEAESARADRRLPSRPGASPGTCHACLYHEGASLIRGIEGKGMLGNSRGRPSAASAPQTREAAEVAFREGLAFRFVHHYFRPSRKTPSG